LDFWNIDAVSGSRRQHGSVCWNKRSSMT
jgi:hypothetical protein